MRNQSPPRTPPSGMSNKTKASIRQIDTQHPPEETFYDDDTPVRDSHPINHSDCPPRDSHDLSLNGTTRDSVVDNMLLSLDSMPTSAMSAFTNPIPPYATFDHDGYFSHDPHYTPPRSTRNRGHTHSSSNPSDYELHPTESAKYHSFHTRQSNSSSNFHPMRLSNETQTGWTKDHRAHHSRGESGKASKSSGASSMDFTYKQGLSAPRHNHMHRSASFDVKYEDFPRPGALQSPNESVMERGRPNPGGYHSFEAAPSPTVYSGPQRNMDTPIASPGFPPAPTYAPPQVPTSRRNSIRSATSRSGKKQPRTPYAESTVLSHANDFYQAATRDGAYETYPESSAPSPSVALIKPAANTTQQPSPKERPGFFRRVFGSSRKENNTPSPQQNTENKTTDERPKTTQSAGRPASKTLSKASPHDTAKYATDRTPSQPIPPPTLNKKHSSFFRRRKKSVVEAMPPALLPLQIQATKNADIEPPRDTPGASSLRQVMNPYLEQTNTNAQRPATHSHENREDSAREFASGYEFGKDASARIVKPDSRGTDALPPSRGNAVKASESIVLDSPKLRLKVKRGKTSPVKPQETTFLADDSGAEDKGPTVGRPDHHQRPSTSPAIPIDDYDAHQHRANTAEKRSKRPSLRQLDIDRAHSSSSIGQSKSQRTVSGNRVWLEPNSDDEHTAGSQHVSPPYEDARTHNPPSAGHQSMSSGGDTFHSTSSLPIVQVDSTESKRPETADEPSAEDRERAKKIFDGDEENTTKARAAALLGESTEKSSKIREAYMELFDWAGQSILVAMRDLCSRLFLKAESQQIDRVIGSFAQRWYDCNPKNGFKSTDIVHAITYSIFLLNTDLHMADIDQKMSRAQFVKNTMPTMRRLADATAGREPEETIKASHAPAQRGFVPWVDQPPAPVRPSSGRVTPSDNTEERHSLENKRSRNRLSIRPSAFRNDSDEGTGFTGTDNCTVLVKAPYEGSMKGWEMQVEIVLKEFYNSIRSHRLPLHGSAPNANGQEHNLSVSSALRRTPSVLSKSTSENMSYRGRSNDFKTTGNRFTSKNRSRPRIYPSSTVGSSRTSLDDQSVWSPAGSSTWSKYSLGKTQTSMMSVNSLGSHFDVADYQQSIGFANALSQAIIREEGNTATNHEEFSRVAPLLEDESLELTGAPWAKEGILKHKHHLETVDKRAKDRGWNECFAVIEKGYMHLFAFGTLSSKSLRAKKSRPNAGGVVGGGNWAENAESLGSFLLRQTIANALPPPGYSKSRPHVWALSLPTGAVHLFQVGTPEIVKEFVSTANYWSARLSKEPLMGGVSNVEYGWSDNVINSALISRPDSSATNHTSHRAGHTRHGSVSIPRPSMQSSIRSSLDYQGTVRARLPGDKVPISDWTPPFSSMMASNLMEIDQQRALQAYVQNIEAELARHNELRPPMLIAFSPRHPNAAKALANWEKKSSYLLREIVKFRTYIEALSSAEERKRSVYEERGRGRREREERDPLSAMSVEVG